MLKLQLESPNNIKRFWHNKFPLICCSEPLLSVRFVFSDVQGEHMPAFILSNYKMHLSINCIFWRIMFQYFGENIAAVSYFSLYSNLFWLKMATLSRNVRITVFHSVYVIALQFTSIKNFNLSIEICNSERLINRII